MSTAATNARFAAELMGALASAGLSEALICPGSRNTPLVLALDALADVTVRSVLDERAAGFVALGSSRARGKATAVCCTSGSALAHLMPAVVEASSSGVPLLILSADRPRELHECGAAQTIDQTRLFGQHVRWFMDLGTPADPVKPHWVASVASQAWSRAHGPSSGPVHLNVPFAEPLWEPRLEQPLGTCAATRLIRGESIVGDTTLGELAHRLRSAERGVIVAGPVDPATLGGFAHTERFTSAVWALADALGWPVVADPLSQLRFCGRTCAGLIAHADAFLRSPAAVQAFNPDLVLRLGRVPTSKAITTWLAGCARSKTICIDEGARWLDPTHGADTLVVAAPTALCRALARASVSDGHRQPAPTSWLESWTRAETEAARVVRRGCSEQGWEGAVVHEIVQRLPPEAVLHVASSMPVRDLDTLSGTRTAPLTVTANRGTNGIDGTVATAAGQALACRGPSVLLCGDLALFHDLGGLAAAAQLPVGLVVIVLDNGGGGIFEYLPIAAHPTSFLERFVTPQSTNIESLCAAVSARYLRAETVSQLCTGLEQNLKADGLTVIHFPIDRQRSVERHRRLFGEVDQAIQRCL